MTRNKLDFEIVDDKTVEINPIKAFELLPILKKNNAYGLEKFKKLITF